MKGPGIKDYLRVIQDKKAEALKGASCGGIT